MRLGSTNPHTAQDRLLLSGIRRVQRAADALTLSRDGQVLRTLMPRREIYQNSGQTMTIPATRSTAREDFYVILAGWEPGGSVATFKVYLNPLINWLWFGGLIFVAGTLVAAWPDVEAERRASGRQALADARVKQYA